MYPTAGNRSYVLDVNRCSAPSTRRKASNQILALYPTSSQNDFLRRQDISIPIYDRCVGRRYVQADSKSSCSSFTHSGTSRGSFAANSGGTDLVAVHHDGIVPAELRARRSHLQLAVL